MFFNNQFPDSLESRILEKFPSLITSRLALREYSVSDLGELQSLLSNEEVMHFSGLDLTKSKKNSESEALWFRQLRLSGSGIRWVITLQGDGRYIGDIGYLNHVKEHQRAEVSYKLSRRHWGRGIMSEAMVAVLRCGFEVMSLNRVEAMVNKENEASLRLLEKHGFQVEGVLREYERLNSIPRDMVLLSLLRNDWLTNSNTYAVRVL
ncbi:MAG: GNAT family protein [Candidatus Bathyarchaeota archaeon]|nr:GNAT family protein [Candidatus Bathyarchaeota archaeon]